MGVVEAGGKFLAIVLFTLFLALILPLYVVGAIFGTVTALTVTTFIFAILFLFLSFKHWVFIAGFMLYVIMIIMFFTDIEYFNETMNIFIK